MHARMADGDGEARFLTACMSSEELTGVFQDGLTVRFRCAQEDAHLIEPAAGDDTSVGVFAVFDGHGGKEVAGFAAMYLVRWPAEMVTGPDKMNSFLFKHHSIHSVVFEELSLSFPEQRLGEGVQNVLVLGCFCCLMRCGRFAHI